jgi:hypothetical protein
VQTQTPLAMSIVSEGGHHGHYGYMSKVNGIRLAWLVGKRHTLGRREMANTISPKIGVTLEIGNASRPLPIVLSGSM